jgi:hypothetical protein
MNPWHKFRPVYFHSELTDGKQNTAYWLNSTWLMAAWQTHKNSLRNKWVHRCNIYVSRLDSIQFNTLYQCARQTATTTPRRVTTERYLAFSHKVQDSVAPNDVVKWLTLLLRIREVQGSNLGPGDRLSWLRFSCFSSVPPSEFQDSALKLGHDPSYLILFNSSSFTNHPIIDTSLVTEKAS